jgi:hypothetical protein
MKKDNSLLHGKSQELLDLPKLFTILLLNNLKHGV